MALIDVKTSESFTKYLYTIDPFSTSNATPQVAYSIPLPQNKAAYVYIQYNNNNTGYTSASGGNVQAVFLRATGNIARTDASTSKGLLAMVLGNFAVSQPAVDIVANTVAQTIDVQLTGKLSTPINWHLEITVYMSN